MSAIKPKESEASTEIQPGNTAKPQAEEILNNI